MTKPYSPKELRARIRAHLRRSSTEADTPITRVGDCDLDVGRSELRRAGKPLALVTHIVEAHGGSVRLESEPGFGSTFTLVSHVSILIVEDDPVPSVGVGVHPADAEQALDHPVESLGLAREELVVWAFRSSVVIARETSSSVR